MSKSDNNITLAIESAVRGGSVAVFCGSTAIGGTLGNEAISNSEDLLSGVEELLKKNNLQKSDIDNIAISSGPGSFTGIRIGIATALGLKNALGRPCVAISLLEALAIISSHNGDVLVAVPMGKKDICWQHFGKSDGKTKSRSEPIAADADTFRAAVAQFPNTAVMIHDDIYHEIFDIRNDSHNYEKTGKNLALAVGSAIISGFGNSDIQPIYVQNQKFLQHSTK